MLAAQGINHDPAGKLRTIPKITNAASTANPPLELRTIIGPPAPLTRRATHMTHVIASTATSATAMALLLTAATKSPRVRLLIARRPPHPGHGLPVSSRNGQNP